MNNQLIFDSIKSSFCNLTNFKIRQNALEIITPFSTINNKFISVFITTSNNKIIITDNGWFNQNYYETSIEKELKITENKIIVSYTNTYNIKSILDKSDIIFFYKTCEKIEQIPSAVFDLANFMVGIVNSFLIQHTEDKEEKSFNKFRNEVDHFLTNRFSEKIQLHTGLDDYKDNKFNAIINQHSYLTLLMYVTGNTKQIFENNLRTSIVNFELTYKSKYTAYIKNRITIFDDSCTGYIPDKQNQYFEILKEKTKTAPTPWTNKQNIFVSCIV